MKAVCMYYKPEFEALKQLCTTLYSLDGCGTGGLLHILLDDSNIQDDDILFCIKECINNPKHPSASIGLIICYEYLKMNLYERAAFDWYWHNDELVCDLVDCGDCPVLDLL